MNAAELLRPGLLQGASLLLAGPPTLLGAAVEEAFSELGAHVSTCLPDGQDEGAIDAAVARVLAEAGSIDVLVVEGAGLFVEGASGALRACLDSAWNVTRAVVNAAFIGRGGRIVFLAPAAEAGEHAMATRAGLENLARTLSVEWARHDVNTIAIAPGSSTSAQEIAALAAYLASPAGTYFSGCLLDLGGGG
ncbi:MAG TPA: SDR family oxidoreductase [Solirubrobacteraceae bacterium]|jgi:NAD(P)-dependent dehydrogenase (short-subunit alcohol dehydrogenase family)